MGRVGLLPMEQWWFEQGILLRSSLWSRISGKTKGFRLMIVLKLDGYFDPRHQFQLGPENSLSLIVEIWSSFPSCLYHHNFCIDVLLIKLPFLFMSWLVQVLHVLRSLSPATTYLLKGGSQWLLGWMQMYLRHDITMAVDAVMTNLRSRISIISP